MKIKRILNVLATAALASTLALGGASSAFADNGDNAGDGGNGFDGSSNNPSKLQIGSYYGWSKISNGNVAEAGLPYRDTGSGYIMTLSERMNFCNGTDQQSDEISKNYRETYVLNGKPTANNNRSWVPWGLFMDNCGSVGNGNVSYARILNTPYTNTTNGSIINASPEFYRSYQSRQTTNGKYTCYWNGTRGTNCHDIVSLRSYSKTFTNGSRTAITRKVWGGGGSNDGGFDNSGKSAKWKWDNVTESVPYSNRSLENEFNHNATLNILVETVTETVTCQTTNGSDRFDCQTPIYTVTNRVPMSNNFRYNVSSASASTQIYTPFNLNRNGYATSSEAEQLARTLGTSMVPGSTGLSGSVNNFQNITDGTALQALDTNNAVPFQILLGNSQAGIPTKSEGGVDITNQATADACMSTVSITRDTSCLSTTGWSANNQTLTQTGGLTDVVPNLVANGYASYNLSFLSGVRGGEYTGRAVSGSQEGDGSSSISTNGTEKIGNPGEALGFAAGWQGGRFDFKATSPKVYHLSSPVGSGDSTYPFWYAQYNNSRPYQYGVAYGGTVTTRGFSNASVSESNMYVGFNRNQTKQPILIGEFDVKTVGGSR